MDTRPRSAVKGSGEVITACAAWGRGMAWGSAQTAAGGKTKMSMARTEATFRCIDIHPELVVGASVAQNGLADKCKMSWVARIYSYPSVFY